MCACAEASGVQRGRIDLSGQWLFSIGDAAVAEQCGIPSFAAADFVRLPGTTDTNKKGQPLARTDETTHLSRRFSFVGKAWYQREVVIPKSWKNKRIHLYMERTKTTTVYVDGIKAGSCNDISVPQRYELTPLLKCGRHTITVEVDNKGGVPPQLFASSHAFTEDTQTNWNGIIGRICLYATNAASIENVQPLVEDGGRRLTVRVAVNGEVRKKSKLTVSLRLPPECSYALPVATKTVGKGHVGSVDAAFDISGIGSRWSEFRPEMCSLTVRLEGQDEVTVPVGLRVFANRPDSGTAPSSHFYINGQKTFLRGKHDACVFPLTAHVPMDTVSWYKYFSTLRQYGVNHVRFHSWCPPEACFAVADEMGFYLQPELPYWGDFNASDTTLMSFLHKEGVKILREYGHHPSFVMFALGNELWGSVDEMRSFVRDFRSADPTKLYTLGSNYYLGYNGTVPEMDYFTTCRIGGEAWGDYSTHTRGSFSFADAKDGGIINHSYPNSAMNLEGAVRDAKMPVISHETGQFQMYPDYGGIGKYSGALRPCNLETFRRRLRSAGMERQSDDFFLASGLWAVQLYKADIELDLRTSDMAGFQLLDLQDYPGQGSACIGILDAFMDSKNLVTPETWRQWCSAVVPLAELSSYCYTVGDTISVGIKVADYSDCPQQTKAIRWQLLNDRGEVIEEGVEPNKKVGENGLLDVADIAVSARLGNQDISERQQLVLSVEGTEFRNTWNLWVYADRKKAVEAAETASDIIIADTLTQQTLDSLGKGATILLMPKATSYQQQTVGGLLQTDYWNYRMFKTICQNNNKPVSPGTLGILVNDAGTALKGFPTDRHADWQWGVILQNSRPLVLDQLPSGYIPIVQVIDNVERNHKLGLLSEFSVGSGKMLVCMSDLRSLTQYPEACQLYESLLGYMRSPSFAPKTSLTENEVRSLFAAKAAETNIKELKNISYE